MESQEEGKPVQPRAFEERLSAEKEEESSGSDPRSESAAVLPEALIQ